jgi:hypothetical protein
MSDEKKLTKQFLLTTAAGKRLIAKSFLSSKPILDALTANTVVILAGTTNGYIAEEILKEIGQDSDFSRDRFFRGITFPPKYTPTKKSDEENAFLGDVVITNGKWEKGKTIFDVADDLKQGDIVIKGANAVNLDAQQAAILIGHPKGGTISPILQAVVGRRVNLFLPIGLEKRISGDINKIAQILNSPEASGPRYMPVTGNIITEIEALKILTGADAELVASGGVCGAEGCYWLAVSGTDDQLAEVDVLIKMLHSEPNFKL